MRRFGIIFLLLACASTVLAACGSSSTVTGSQAIPLTFWYTEDSSQSAPILNAVKAFNTSNPSIHVTAINVDLFSAHDRFQQAAKIGTSAPDIFAGTSLWTAEFANAGYLLPLDGQVGATDDFNSAALASNNFSGHLYGLPETFDFQVMYYNKKILNAAGVTAIPQTFSELSGAASLVSISAQGSYPFATAGTFDSVMPFIYGNGGDAVTGTNNVVINSSAASTGLRNLTSLLNSNEVLPFNAQDGEAVIDTAFKNGKVAMIFAYASLAADFKSGTAFSSNSSDFGIAAIPSTNSSTLRGTASGLNLSIFKGTAHAKEAETFLKYMTDSTRESAFTAANGTIPPRKSVLQNASSNGTLLFPVQLAATAKARPVTAVTKQLIAAFDRDIQQSFGNSSSLQATLDTIATDWKTLLK